MIRFLILFIIFICCGQFSYAQLSEKEEFNIRAQENALNNPGVFVGTITINNASRRKFSYKIVIKSKERIEGKTIIDIIPRKYRKLKFQPDYWDGDKAVYAVVWKRNEGDYHVAEILPSLYYNELDRNHFCSFTVKENTITYFGNIEINDGDFTVTHTDLKDRDLLLIYKKFPHSNWNKYENGNIILNATQH